MVKTTDQLLAEYRQVPDNEEFIQWLQSLSTDEYERLSFALGRGEGFYTLDDAFDDDEGR